MERWRLAIADADGAKQAKISAHPIIYWPLSSACLRHMSDWMSWPSCGVDKAGMLQSRASQSLCLQWVLVALTILF